MNKTENNEFKVKDAFSIPSIIHLKDETANPAPLGLFGFAITTILLNLHNAGFMGLDTIIMGLGIFVGGFAQVMVGFMEWKKGNTFGTTAFTAYGFFWISLVAAWILPKMGLGDSPTAFSVGCYLFIWGLFSLGMFIGTLKLNRALQLVFGSLTILFFLLAIGDFTGSHLIKTIAGFEGIFCGFTAFYASLAQVINEVYGKTILPMGFIK